MRSKTILAAVAVAITCIFGGNTYAQTTWEITVPNLTDTFSPDTLTIQAGDTVRWTNLQNGNVHNVFEQSQTNWDNPGSLVQLPGGFTSGAQGAVDTFEFVFNDGGTFYYSCSPHKATGMKGQITVTPAPTPTPIPTLTQWGLIAMTLLLFGVGAFILRRHGPSPA